MMHVSIEQLETDFGVAVWEDESDGDCDLVTLPESERPLIELV